MKNLIALFCAVSAFAAFAADSDILFGALRVDSTAEQTIVSIPWAEAGTGGAVKVKDAIKTTNLTKGDQLFYYDAAAKTPAYKFWQLGNNGWEGATTVLNEITTDQGSDEDTLARGGALILVRQKPTKEDGTANPFYLYGQYTADAASLNVVEGTAEKPAYSLVAPAATEATDLDSLASANVGASDTVVVRDSSGNTRALVCRKDESTSTYKWGNVVKFGMGGSEQFTPVSITIPAGEGFWYISRGGSLTSSDSNN